MPRSWKSRALFFCIGLVVGAGVWCGLNYERLSEMKPSSQLAVAQKNASNGEEAPWRGGSQALPPIPQISAEKPLRQAVRDYADYWEASSTGKLEKAKLAAILKEVGPLKSDDWSKLSMYKYPLRSVGEKLHELDPSSKYLETLALAGISKSKEENGAAKGWQFSPFEEAVYQTYFTDKNKDFPLNISLEIFLAIRNGDYAKMEELHNRIGLGPAPRWPLEAFRQLYASSNLPSDSELVEELKKLLPEEKDWQRVSWCEIGYGNGRIFSALRGQLGPQGAIWAVETDSSCQRFVKDLLASGLTDWGEIKLIDGSYKDCHIPAGSVDIAHVGLDYLGEGPYEQIRRDGLPFLASIKKALKKDGWLLVDSPSQPSPDRVRTFMKMAGFKEVKAISKPHTDWSTPYFGAAFTSEN